MDLLFVIDGSGSIESSGKGNFDKVKNFVEDLITSFGVSKEGTHVAIIVYSDQTKVRMPPVSFWVISLIAYRDWPGCAARPEYWKTVENIPIYKVNNTNNRLAKSIMVNTVSDHF